MTIQLYSMSQKKTVIQQFVQSRQKKKTFQFSFLCFRFSQIDEQTSMNRAQFYCSYAPYAANEEKQPNDSVTTIRDTHTQKTSLTTRQVTTFNDFALTWNTHKKTTWSRRRYI